MALLNVTPLLTAPHPALYRFLDLLTWADREVPDRHFLVPGLIPDGCVTSLYGDGGAGKTLLALGLMVAMASKGSRLWLGQKAAGWKSVGLFSEDDEHEIVRRLQRICAAEGLDFAMIAPRIKALAGVGVDTVIACFADTGELVITPLMDALIAKVREEGASLLVIDYAASVFGGNELDRLQVSAFMRRLNAIARDNEIAILLLGHPSQSGMAGGRGTSGSTAWRNQARSFLHLTVDDNQDDPDGRRLLTLTHSKSNYSRTGLVFRIASDGARFDVLGTSDAPIKKISRTRLSPAVGVALRALHRAIAAGCDRPPCGVVPPETPYTTISRWREIAYDSGISPSDNTDARRRAFHRALNALKAKGQVGVDGPLVWITKGAGQ